MNVTFHDHKATELSELIRQKATLAVCGLSRDTEDAMRLLDMLGLVQQPAGRYARSDEELIAAGQVCLKGHPLNRRNARIRAGRRVGGCEACK